MSVEWADISQFNSVVTDAYPYPVLAFRSNDGTYRDPHFAQNLAWCKAAVASGKIAFFIVYAVYEPDGGNWVTTLMNMVGTPHPAMVVMFDVESWSGRITGDHSADINAGRARIAGWLGDSRRVIGYGNVGDLNRLWPNKGDTQLVVAAYGSNPSYPGKIAHQYTDAATVPGIGSGVDMNSADGYDIPTLMSALGIGATLADLGATPFNPTLEEDMTTIYQSGGSYLVHFGGPSFVEVGQTLTVQTGVDGPQLLAALAEGKVPTVPVGANTYNIIKVTLKVARDQNQPPAPVVPAPTIDTQALAKAIVAALPTSTVPPTAAEIVAAFRAELATNPLTGSLK